MQQAILMMVLATMVYSVSLDLRVKDFRYVATHPAAVCAGLVAQFVLLPGATLLATLVLDLPPATEAAMMLVAACPGGALSNVITFLGRGNLALSLSISAVSNVLALVLTPLNFTLMVAANPETAAWSRSIAVDPKDLVISLVLLLALPMTAAMLTTLKAPVFAVRIRQPCRVGVIEIRECALFQFRFARVGWVEPVVTLGYKFTRRFCDGLEEGRLFRLTSGRPRERECLENRF